LLKPADMPEPAAPVRWRRHEMALSVCAPTGVG
jgi:hypothetical protein